MKFKLSIMLFPFKFQDCENVEYEIQNEKIIVNMYCLVFMFNNNFFCYFSIIVNYLN